MRKRLKQPGLKFHVQQQTVQPCAIHSALHDAPLLTASPLFQLLLSWSHQQTTTNNKQQTNRQTAATPPRFAPAQAHNSSSTKLKEPGSNASEATVLQRR
eukprot:TRINITY_DN2127_c0_g1_i1.p2 TRINITY_DN2127_c0_g1~~TRINITY_DN2127_c0_g1_i1.p2  ORF type:complete len:100 (+),score=19.51 TRINITY_DN2127_c0_g1_i1:181-480(+)